MGSNMVRRLMKAGHECVVYDVHAEAVDEQSLEGGELGGNKDYGDIFGDANLFKDFGGFDTKED